MWPKWHSRVHNIIKVCGELQRGSSVGLIGIQNTLRAGRSGNRTPVGKIYFVFLQKYSPALGSYATGVGVLYDGKAAGA